MQRFQPFVCSFLTATKQHKVHAFVDVIEVHMKRKVVIKKHKRDIKTYFPMYK